MTLVARHTGRNTGRIVERPEDACAAEPPCICGAGAAGSSFTMQSGLQRLGQHSSAQ
jgi:hypothetical protein